MSDWLSPYEPWPGHERDSANEAFEYAKAHGWWFKPSEKGHLFGTLTCCSPTGEVRLHEACHPRVARSAWGDVDETAQFIRRKVRNCPHEWDESPEAIPTEQLLAKEKFEVLLDYLGKIDALAGAFERLLAADSEAQRRDELLETMVEIRDESLTAYAETERAASEADDAIARLRQDAQEEADALALGSPPWPPPNPGDRLLLPAEQYVEIAQKMIDGKAGEAVELARQRLDERCMRINELRRAHEEGDVPAD